MKVHGTLDVKGSTSFSGSIYPSSGLLNLIGDSGGEMEINMTAPGANGDVGMRSALATATLVLEADKNAEIDNSEIRFEIDGAQKMVLDTDGQLGIGTTSPGSKLDIRSGYAQILTNDSTNNNASIALQLGSDRSDRTGNITAVRGASSVFIGLGFETSNNAAPAEVMRIQPDGSVGIGTSSPTEKLEVAGSAIFDGTNANIKIKSGTTGTSGSINWTFNTDSTVFSSIVLAYDDRSTDGLKIDSISYPTTCNATTYHRWELSNAEKMRLDSTGLGIGTTSPQDILHIQATADPAIRLNESATSTSYTALEHAGFTQTILEHIANTGQALVDINPRPSDGTSSAIMRLFRNTNTSGGKTLQLLKGDGTATIEASIGVDGASSYFNVGGGNVGIGTASPDTNLHIVDSANAELALEDTGATYHTALIDDGDSFVIQGRTAANASTGNEYIVTRGASGPTSHQWNIGGATKMAIDSDGDVVVGGSSALASAAFQITSTTKGFLPPRVTTTQKNAIASPASGLVVYDSTLNKLCVYTGSAWETVTSA